MTDSIDNTMDRPGLDGALESKLRRLIGRIRVYVLAIGLARVTAVLFLGGCLQLAIDWSLRGLRWDMRCALFLVILALSAWQAWVGILKPWNKRITLSDVAALLERRYPSLESSLISAIRFASGELGSSSSNSPAMAAAVVRSAGRRTEALDFDSVLNPQSARRSAICVVTMLAVVLLSFAISAPVIKLWFMRNVLLQNHPWPKQTTLHVNHDGQQIFGAKGDDIVIRAHADGVQPRKAEIHFQTERGDSGRETMVAIGSTGKQTFRHTFRNAQHSLEFYVTGGDDRTEPYQIKLVDRPDVESLNMIVQPPEYTKLPVLELADGQRSAEVFPGSLITLSGMTNKPISSVRLMKDRQEVASAQPSTDRFSLTVKPEASASLRLMLVDQVGLENKRPINVALRMKRDEPPHVRMTMDGVGEMVTPEALLAISVEFADLLGVASAVIRHERLGENGATGTIELDGFTSGTKTFSDRLTWPISAVEASPGHRLVFVAEASDFDDVSGPNVGRSARVTLRVVTREELLAELARREREIRMDFERLVDSQESLRGALLTLLRQHQQGMARDDLVTALVALDRRQRNIISSVAIIRRQFEQVLAEMLTNQVATSDEESRLAEGIIPKLRKLAARELPPAADAIRQWSRSSALKDGKIVDPLQIQALNSMHEILDVMVQWEGYQEMVTMLRDMIRLQDELKSETLETMEKEAVDVFEE